MLQDVHHTVPILQKLPPRSVNTVLGVAHHHLQHATNLTTRVTGQHVVILPTDVVRHQLLHVGLKVL
jgi:hypothetical protein